MIDSTYTAFFGAAAAAAAGLIGLLFVALSLAVGRPNLKDDYVALETRAGAALLTFMNVLVVCLLALIPGVDPGWAAIVIGLVGELYVAASVVPLTEYSKGDPEAEAERAESSRGLIAVLAVAFGFQIVVGVLVTLDSGSRTELGLLAAGLVASLVIGISRTWEIVGVRDPGIRASLRLLRRR